MAKKPDWVIGIIISLSTLFVVAMIGALIFMAMKDHSVGFDTSRRKIGVIDVQGVISDSRSVVRQLKKYTDDRSLPVIVVRIDSPGGSVAASQEIYNEIRWTRKRGTKVIASMASVA